MSSVLSRNIGEALMEQQYIQETVWKWIHRILFSFS